jgi:release factor glutamine methyltransferase
MMSPLDTQVQKLKDEKYAGAETADFVRDKVRLASGEPYEYVLGHTIFLGAHIDLSLLPMIPRYETAFWVERAIAELKVKQKSMNRPLRLADTFSGAGNVGIAVLKHLPSAQVEISELDPNLKVQIEINLEKNTIEPSRVHVVTASGLEGLTGKYDAIFAVPPYVPYSALPDLDPEMINFEPHLAFFAHNEGHEFHELLIEKAYDYLEEGGTLYMETDMDHEEWIRNRVHGTKWSHLEFWADPYGATPNVVLRK